MTMETEDKFELRMNFPPIVVYLKEMLISKCKISNACFNSMIDFEDDIMKEAGSKQLVFTCKKNSEHEMVTGSVKTFTFSVAWKWIQPIEMYD